MSDDCNKSAEVNDGTPFAEARGSVPTVKLSSGHEVPEYILCEKCGEKLHISPNTKGAFSYQGCNCHEPDWMQ